MRGEIRFSHRKGDIVSLLTSLYEPHDPGALQESVLAMKAPGTAQSIVYAARTRGLTVMAERVGRKRAVVYVESSGGRLRIGAEEIWSDIRDGKMLKPKLDKIVLFDEDASEDVATASAGVGASLSRGDLFLPIATGIVTAFVLGGVAKFGHGSADFVYGSIPALGVAILSVMRLFAQSRSKAVVWR